MKITEPLLRARPLLVPLRPEVANALVSEGVFNHPAGKVVWASSQVAIPAPGSALNLVPAASLPGGAQFHPVKLSDAGCQRLSQALGIGEAAVPLVEKFAPNLPGQTMDGVAALLASGEMVKQWVSPTHQSGVEQALFWTQKTASVLDFAADVIPALHSAKPVFSNMVLLCRFGNDVYAVFKDDKNKKT